MADPQPAETVTHAKSDCVIESSGGEYPLYRVLKDERIIFAPKSDGILTAHFSPSGNYIAFSGSEINWVDLGDMSFSVVILECSSGNLNGFTRGYPGVDTKWRDNLTYQYNDTASGALVSVRIVPEEGKPFLLREEPDGGN